MQRSNANLFTVAPFTMVVLAINIGLFVLTSMRSGGFMMMDTKVLSDLGASQRERVWEGEWFRLVAPMFLHGGLLHIFMNMQFLWRAGPDAEAYFGTANYGTIYLLSGLTGVCLSQIFGGHLSIGASGSLCGIMGAHLAVQILRVPVARYAWRSQAVRAEVYNILFLLGIGIIGFLPMDNWGHFGGILGGFAFGLSFELWRNRSIAGKLTLFASLAMVVALVCAARWTVFNPTYHVFNYAYAKDVVKDDALATSEVAEARRWAALWTPVHFLGVLNPKEVDNLIIAHRLGGWSIDDAVNPRYMMLTIAGYFRDGKQLQGQQSVDDELPGSP